MTNPANGTIRLNVFYRVSDYKEFKAKNNIKSLRETINRLKTSFNEVNEIPQKLEIIQKDSKFLLNNFKQIREQEKGRLTCLFCKLFPQTSYAKKIQKEDQIIRETVFSFSVLVDKAKDAVDKTKAMKKLGNNTRELWNNLDDASYLSSLKKHAKDIDDHKFVQDSEIEIRKWLTCDPNDAGDMIKQSKEMISKKYYNNNSQEGDLLPDDWVSAMFKAMLISVKNQLSDEDLGKLVSLKDQFSPPLASNEQRFSLELAEIDQLAMQSDGLKTKEKWELAKEQIKKKENPNDEYVLHLVGNGNFSKDAASEIQKWLNSKYKPGAQIFTSVGDMIKLYEPETYIGGEKTNEFVLAMLIAAASHLKPQELAQLKKYCDVWYDKVLSVSNEEIRAMERDKKEKYNIESAYIERLYKQIKTADLLAVEYKT